MASTGTAPAVVRKQPGTVPVTSPAAHAVDARRHIAWLVGGMAGSFLVPFVFADQLGLQRDLYYAVYVAAVVGLFVAWARDTRQSLGEMLARRWRVALGLGVVFAAVSAFTATRAEGGATHPGGLEFIAALGWRGVVPPH